MGTFNIITLFLILLGSGLMLFAILNAVKLLRLLKAKKYHNVWKILWSLMVFFLIGYLAAAGIVYYEKEHILLLITGMVFFFGALFVSIVVRTGFLSINDFFQINVRLTQERNELRLAEKKVQELNKNLEQKVLERTAQIEEANKKLLESKEALRIKSTELEKNLHIVQIANKELESFSYTASHDLRQPVRAINGFISLVKKNYGDKLDAEGKELIETIVNESIKMGQLIEDLLKFQEFGKCTVNKSKADMNNIANEVVTEFLKPGNKNAVTIKVGMLPACFCDGHLLRQVLMNLVSNAIKFTQPRKDPLIEIGSNPDSDAIIYYVKDNGIGFDMKYYNKLFGIFQRLHSDDSFQGTGIGLAIVKKIIERHNGKVWADGEVNKGATFYFSIPKQI